MGEALARDGLGRGDRLVLGPGGGWEGVKSAQGQPLGRAPSVWLWISYRLLVGFVVRVGESDCVVDVAEWRAAGWGRRGRGRGGSEGPALACEGDDRGLDSRAGLALGFRVVVVLVAGVRLRLLRIIHQTRFGV